jgi:hypothetical protein
VRPLKKITHDELVFRAVKWLRHSKRCRLVITESGANEKPDAIGFTGDGSILIECKTSVSDFYSDRKKRWRKKPELGMGGLRYYLTPPKLIRKKKLPEGWGLLECRPKSILTIKPAAIQSTYNPFAEINLVINFLAYIIGYQSNYEDLLKGRYAIYIPGVDWAISKSHTRRHAEKIKRALEWQGLDPEIRGKDRDLKKFCPNLGNYLKY